MRDVVVIYYNNSSVEIKAKGKIEKQIEANRGAAARNVTVNCDWLWVRSPLEIGVEFCHSTRSTSRIRQKVGNGVS